jgi:hypothetical protein
MDARAIGAAMPIDRSLANQSSTRPSTATPNRMSHPPALATGSEGRLGRGDVAKRRPAGHDAAVPLEPYTPSNTNDHRQRGIVFSAWQDSAVFWTRFSIPMALRMPE